MTRYMDVGTPSVLLTMEQVLSIAKPPLQPALCFRKSSDLPSKCLLTEPSPTPGPNGGSVALFGKAGFPVAYGPQTQCGAKGDVRFLLSYLRLHHHTWLYTVQVMNPVPPAC